MRSRLHFPKGAEKRPPKPKFGLCHRIFCRDKACLVFTDVRIRTLWRSLPCPVFRDLFYDSPGEFPHRWRDNDRGQFFWVLSGREKACLLSTVALADINTRSRAAGFALSEFVHRNGPAPGVLCRLKHVIREVESTLLLDEPKIIQNHG